MDTIIAIIAIIGQAIFAIIAIDRFANIANNSDMSDLAFQDKIWLSEKLDALPHGDRGKVAAFGNTTPTKLSRMANVDPEAPPKNTQIIPIENLRRFAEYFKDLPPSLRVDNLVRPAGPEASEVDLAESAPPLSRMGDYTVELRGVTAGGADDEFRYNNALSKHVRRPPGISNTRNVFALAVTGTSMEPRYFANELIYVHRARSEPGDFVVVELYPENEQDEGKSFLKRLVRRTGLRITCEQYNPPKMVEFDAGEVREIYRVLPLDDLLG